MSRASLVFKKPGFYSLELTESNKARVLRVPFHGSAMPVVERARPQKAQTDACLHISSSSSESTVVANSHLIPESQVRCFNLRLAFLFLCSRICARRLGGLNSERR